MDRTAPSQCSGDKFDMRRDGPVGTSYQDLPEPARARSSPLTPCTLDLPFIVPQTVQKRTALPHLPREPRAHR